MNNNEFYKINFTPIYICVATIAILAFIHMIVVNVRQGFNTKDIISNLIGIVFGILCNACLAYIIIKVLERPGEYLVYIFCVLGALSLIGNIVAMFN